MKYRIILIASLSFFPEEMLRLPSACFLPSVERNGLNMPKVVLIPMGCRRRRHHHHIYFMQYQVSLGTVLCS